MRRDPDQRQALVVGGLENDVASDLANLDSGDDDVLFVTDREGDLALAAAAGDEGKSEEGREDPDDRKKKAMAESPCPTLAAPGWNHAQSFRRGATAVLMLWITIFGSPGREVNGGRAPAAASAGCAPAGGKRAATRVSPATLPGHLRPWPEIAMGSLAGDLADRKPSRSFIFRTQGSG
jgi:hypothetical protein